MREPTNSRSPGGDRALGQGGVTKTRKGKRANSQKKEGKKCKKEKTGPKVQGSFKNWKIGGPKRSRASRDKRAVIGGRESIPVESLIGKEKENFGGGKRVEGDRATVPIREKKKLKRVDGGYGG